jgi:hypothetical protein
MIMNIFYLDSNPKICAQYHSDKHVIKMILESAQLLSTAHHVVSEAMPEITQPYNYLNTEHMRQYIMKPSYINHPCNIWVRQSLSNYFWLAELAWELCKEYTHRYDKIHKREPTVVYLLDNWPKHIPHDEFTEPPCCMPDYCKIEGTIESYREYYMQEKAYFAKWKKRSTPGWYNVKG